MARWEVDMRPAHLLALAAACLATTAPLHAETVLWAVDAPGSWTDPANWSSNPALPSSTSDVTLDRPTGDYLVTLDSGNQSIHSLLMSEPVLVTAGSTLNVSATLGVVNTLTVSSATLKGATLSTAGAGQVVVTAATFDSVTLASNLAVSNTYLSVRNGLTLADSTITLTGTTATAALTPIGTQTVGGTGAIVYDGTYNPTANVAGNSTLTLAPGITVRTGTAGGGIITSGTVINQGVIASQTSGKTLGISTTPFLNQGTLLATNGGVLALNGTLSVAQLGIFSASGGVIRIGGVLDNSNNALALTGGTNSLAIAGTLKGGTLTNATGLTLSSSSTFQEVTLATNLTPTSILWLSNGLSLDGVTLSLPNTATLWCLNSGTLGGSGTVLFTGTTGGKIEGTNYTLTLAPGITARTGAGGGTLEPSHLINQGVISAQTAGRTLAINTKSFLNTGTLQVLDSGSLNLSTQTAILGGTLLVGNGGTLVLSRGTVTLAAPLQVNNGTVKFDAHLFNAGSIGGTGKISVGVIGTLVCDGMVASSLSIDNIAVIRANGTNTGTSKLGALTLLGVEDLWFGKLDLNDNALILQTNGAADKNGRIPTLQNQILNGKHGGDWLGMGLTSSTVAANATTASPSLTLALADNADLHYTSFRGQTLDENALIILQVPIGDATMDGKVDAFDLNKLAAHWQQPTGALWSAGDFTGDGKVDAFDLNALASHWQYGVGSLEAALAAFPALAGSVTPVPEPASVLVALLAIPWTGTRRWKRGCYYSPRRKAPMREE
jgi:hypothetical protein